MGHKPLNLHRISSDLDMGCQLKPLDVHRNLSDLGTVGPGHHHKKDWIKHGKTISKQ